MQKILDGLPQGVKQMVLTVSTKQGELVFTPAADAEGRVTWGCTNGAGLKPTQLPPACHK